MPEDKVSDKRRKMSVSEKLTYSTVKIRCDYKDCSAGSGTGVIIHICENKEKQTCVPILVTNKHVIENSTQVLFDVCKTDDNGNPIDTETLPITLKDCQWFNHPDPAVDLCCTNLALILKFMTSQGIKPFYIPLSLNLIPSAETLEKMTALEDVVMIGYPIGLSDSYNHKPIIRRGATATHPKNDYQGKKETLLDIAALPGSSGSPVFILNQGAYSTVDGVTLSSSPRILFLGVLWGGPEYDAIGTLQFMALPNKPMPVTSIPTNLGMIIKSERIREFEKLFPPPTGEN